MLLIRFFRIGIFLLLILNNSAWAKNIKIALVAPLSGPYSGYGTSSLIGASQAVKDINNHLSEEEQIELIPYDDKNDNEIALQLAKKLSSDESISAVIGHSTSSTTLATMEQYASKGKLIISPSATNPKITQRGIFTLFRICGRDDHQAKILAEFIAHRLQSQRVAILHDQDIYGKELADYLIENLISLDKTPVLYQGIPRGTKNFDPLLNKLKELEVDAVFFAALYPEVAALANVMHDNKIQLPLITGDGVLLNSFLKETKIHAIDSVMMSFGNTGEKNSNGKQVIKEMKNKNLTVDGYTLYAYAAVETIAQASDATNSTQGSSLAYWLHQNTVESVLGKLSWDTNGDIMNDNYHMYIWDQTGKYKPIPFSKR